jgi:NAD(P)-dependent dehydrogenase (short-subunit alcohol dehydrogenase family)
MSDTISKISSYATNYGIGVWAAAKAFPYAAALGTTIVVLGGLKWMTGTRKCDSLENLKDKSVCITGGNVGIGLTTAEECARAGALNVVILCRNVKSAAEAEESIRGCATNTKFEVLTVACDLGDLASVRLAVKILEEANKPFDILFLNAGLMMVEKGTTKDGFETHIGVNHFGHFLLTNLILKANLLKENGRVVSLTSSANRIWSNAFDIEDLNFTRRPYSAASAYAASKTANILMMQELQRRFDVEGKGRIAASVHPGFVRTKLMRESSKYFLLPIYPLYWAVSLSPKEGTQNSLYAATSPDMKQLGGRYLENLRPAKPSHDDPELAVKFWEESEKAVRL